VMRAGLPVREVLEPPVRRVIAAALPRARLDRYAPRAYVAAAPPSAPESSDDH
jgi:hypothetical protein